LTHFAGARNLHRYGGGIAQAYLGRRFAAGSARRLLIYYHPLEISWSQIYPFLYYEEQLARRFDVQIRCLPVDGFLTGQTPTCGTPDMMLIQPWFTVDGTILAARLEAAKKDASDCEISFVDSFAHADLRLGQYVEPYIEFYLKKGYFKDRAQHLRPTYGDTNLTEYYGALYGIDQEQVDWHIPERLLPKLRLSPNFFTSPKFINTLHNASSVPAGDRPIDMQTRIGKSGGGWYYQRMRQHSVDQVAAIENLRISPPGKLNYKAFMLEMRQSKLCFSPFGYGELCWRDIEAMVSGTVLIKPNMGHLDTLPDLYEPDVTYLTVSWDFSDLEEVVRHALADTEQRERIADAAFRRMVTYVREETFVDDISFLFSAQSQDSASTFPAPFSAAGSRHSGSRNG